MASPAQVAATTKYIKNHTRRYTIQCHRERDAHIIEFLDGKENYTAYVKGLIRREIAEKDGK